MKCTIVFWIIIINLYINLSVFGCPFGWRPVISKGAMISCSYHQKICESLNLDVLSQCKQARWAVSESLVCCTVDIRDAASLLSMSASSSKANVFLPIPSMIPTEAKVWSTLSTSTPTTTTPLTTTTTIVMTTTTTHSETTTTTRTSPSTTSTEHIVHQQPTFNTTRTPSSTSVYRNVWTHRQIETDPLIKNNPNSNGVVESHKNDNAVVGESHTNNQQQPNVFNVGTELLHVGAELVHVGSELLSYNRLKTSETNNLKTSPTTERSNNALIENENFNVRTLLLPQKNVERDGGEDDELSHGKTFLLPSKTTTTTTYNTRPVPITETIPSDVQMKNLNYHGVNVLEHGKMLNNNAYAQFQPSPVDVDSSPTQIYSSVDDVHSKMYGYSKILTPNVHSSSTVDVFPRPPMSNVQSPIYQSIENKLIDEYSKVSTPDQYSKISAPGDYSTISTSDVAFETSSNVNVTQLYILPDGVTQVIQLIEGKKMGLLDTKLLQKRAFTSVTLLRTPRKNILVDAGWPMDKYLLVDVLWKKMKINAATDIHHVVITKDGVDTMGAVSDFASADVITPHVYIKKSHAWKHPAVTGRSWYLDDGVVITPTSGIYGREISVLVKNAVGYGRVAIVGRLFMQPNGDVGEFLSIPRGAFARRSKNRKKIICNVDYVIPIYDKMFKVTKAMQKRHDCPTIK